MARAEHEAAKRGFCNRKHPVVSRVERGWSPLSPANSGRIKKEIKMESLLAQIEAWLITLIDKRIDGRVEETITDLIDEKIHDEVVNFNDDFDISEYESEIIQMCTAEIASTSFTVTVD